MQPSPTGEIKSGKETKMSTESLEIWFDPVLRPDKRYGVEPNASGIDGVGAVSVWSDALPDCLIDLPIYPMG